MAWLTGWDYRKSHTLTGTAAGAQTNYQVKILVHRSSGSDSGNEVYVDTKCEADFGDLRFTKSDGDTLLDYWLQEQDGTDAIFWVEVDTIPVSPNTVDIYVYYGKSGQATTSDGDNTFIFFDDFPGASVDVGKWTNRAGAFTVGSSILTLTGVASGRGLMDGQTAMTYGQYRALAKWTAAVGCTAAHYHSMRTTNSWTTGKIDDYGHLATQAKLDTRVTGTTTQSIVTIGNPTLYNIFRFTWKSGEVKFYSEDTILEATHTTNIPAVALVPVMYEGATVGEDAFVDWVTAQKWVDPEPTHTSWGSEESAPVAGGELQLLVDGGVIQLLVDGGVIQKLVD
jgi:hypothetical protein